MNTYLTAHRLPIFGLAFFGCIGLVLGPRADAAGGPISSTEIEDCVVSDLIECTQKMVTTVPVAYGQMQRLDLMIDGEPVSIEITKSAPRFIYPLIYHNTIPITAESEVLFAGFEAERPRLDYTVRLVATKGSSVFEFDLSPGSPTYGPVDFEEQNGFAPPFQIAATLAGDSAPAIAIPEFGNSLLYIPNHPETHPFVQNFQQYILLVPREEISYEGTECNKAGYVSRTRWGLKRGVCLKNQLLDKLNEDFERLIVNPNFEAEYLVSGKRLFRRSMEFLTDPGVAPERTLSYKATDQMLYTQVALTTDPSEIKRVTSESDGVIVEAFVEDNMAHSRNLTLTVNILNTGDIKANYIATVTDCSPNIVESRPAQAPRTLAPLDRDTLYFDIYTKDNLDATNQCTVSLRSASRKLDSVAVIFDTTMVPYDLNLQAPNL